MHNTSKNVKILECLVDLQKHLDKYTDITNLDFFYDLLDMVEKQIEKREKWLSNESNLERR